MKSLKSSNSAHSFTRGTLQPYSINNLINLRLSKHITPKESQHQPAFHNTRQKLHSFQTALQETEAHLQRASDTNKEIRHKIAHIRQDMLGQGVDELEQKCQGLLHSLKKRLHIASRSEKLRFDSLQQVTDALARNQSELAFKVNQIDERVTAIEQVMGTQNGLRNQLNSI